MELTEEDKDRLRGSYKVAKKLEKLENKQKDFSEDEDEDSDNNNDLELPSLESVYSGEEQDNVDGKEEVTINDSNSGSNSDFNSQPASLTDSMAMVNKQQSKHIVFTPFFMNQSIPFPFFTIITTISIYIFCLLIYFSGYIW